MHTKSFSLRSRYASIRYAISGICRFLREEPNARLHGMATVLLAILSCFFYLSAGEKIALVIVTAGVWIAEAFNTVVERIMDMVSPHYHPQAGYIKDLAAGAVLVAAIAALATGGLVFIPKIFNHVYPII
ncbi:MAG: diacylglycerol kinase family protein [Chitinophagaceae bacterium]